MLEHEFEKHRTELIECVAMTYRVAALVAIITLSGCVVAACTL